MNLQTESLGFDESLVLVYCFVNLKTQFGNQTEIRCVQLGLFKSKQENVQTWVSSLSLVESVVHVVCMRLNLLQW